MFGAELIDFMVELVSNPELFIIFSVVEDCVIYHIFAELVDDLNFVEVDHCPIRCSAGDVCYDISLD